MITEAAVRYGASTVVSGKPPMRHIDIRREVWKAGKTEMREMGGVDGFLTHDGVFLGRLEALQHAQACGQTLLCKTPHPLGLFSEDLW